MTTMHSCTRTILIVNRRCPPPGACLDGDEEKEREDWYVCPSFHLQRAARLLRRCDVRTRQEDDGNCAADGFAPDIGVSVEGVAFARNWSTLIRLEVVR